MQAHEMIDQLRYERELGRAKIKLLTGLNLQGEVGARVQKCIEAERALLGHTERFLAGVEAAKAGE